MVTLGEPLTPGLMSFFDFDDLLRFTVIFFLTCLVSSESLIEYKRFFTSPRDFWVIYDFYQSHKFHSGLHLWGEMSIFDMIPYCIYIAPGPPNGL